MTMNLEEKKQITREGKRKADHDDTEDLLVKFFGTFTADDFGPSYYRIMTWTDPEVQYGTQVVKVPYGDNFGIFNKLEIPLDSSARYLYIELLKGITWRDPGTSNGTILMGRGKIRLPPPSSRGRVICHKVRLVVLNSEGCVVEKGTLEAVMKRLLHQ